MDNTTTKTPYILDDPVEFFQFSLRGHVYKFRYMTIEETDRFKSALNDEQASRDMLMSFISSDEEGAPPITEQFNKMTIPEWKRFQEMVKSELS